MELKKFIKDTSLLFVFILLSRVLGMFFRIPFDYFFGLQALGLYDIVFPIYSILFALSTVGFVSSISNNMAAKASKKEKYEIFQLESRLTVSIGIFVSLIIFLLKDWAITFFGLPSTIIYSLNIVLILPVITAGIANYRGFFQSIQRSNITGISIMIEQLSRTILGLLIAYGLKQNNYSMGVIVSGAYGGILIGSMISFVFLFYHYRTISRDYWGQTVDTSKERSELVPILLSIVSYVIIALFLITITFIDVLTIPKYLNLLGFNENNILTLMGMRARALTIANIPLIISSVVIMNLIPNAAKNIFNPKKFKIVVQNALEFSIYLLIPSVIGIFILAQELLKLFFNASLGSHYLQLMIFKILLVVIIQIIINVINIVNDYRFIIQSFFIVVILKIGLNYLFVWRYSLLIEGAIIATIVLLAAFLGLLIYYLYQTIGLNVLRLRRLYYAIVFSLIMLVVIIVVKQLVLVNVSLIVLIISSVLIGCLSYLLLIYFVDRDYLIDIL